MRMKRWTTIKAAAAMVMDMDMDMDMDMYMGVRVKRWTTIKAVAAMVMSISITAFVYQLETLENLKEPNQDMYTTYAVPSYFNVMIESQTNIKYIERSRSSFRESMAAFDWDTFDRAEQNQSDIDVAQVYWREFFNLLMPGC